MRIKKISEIRTITGISFKRFRSNHGYGLEKKWAYYNQEAIDREASKPLYRLTPTQLMYGSKFSDGSHLLKSSQYLQKELPRRISRRVKDFQSLPYVVAINPTMQEVYELYLRAFHKLISCDPITKAEHEMQYSKIVAQLLDDHKDVVTSLSKAFHEVKNLIPYQVLGSLIERTLTSRLGIRLLAEHHLGLRHEKEKYIGVICINMSPKSIIEKCVYYCKKMCDHKYGSSPAVFVSGHTKAQFAHIPPPIEYILQELIKNAMRATVVHHSENHSEMPPIEITICNNEEQFMVKISDRGGGIPDNYIHDIFQYSFSTTQQEEEQLEVGNTFDGFIRSANKNQEFGTLSGYGFGLPSSLAYANFLGGSLQIIPMYRLGTDVFLKLSHISKGDCFRI